MSQLDTERMFALFNLTSNGVYYTLIKCNKLWFITLYYTVRVKKKCVLITHIFRLQLISRDRIWRDSLSCLLCAVPHSVLYVSPVSVLSHTRLSFFKKNKQLTHSEDKAQCWLPNWNSSGSLVLFFLAGRFVEEQRWSVHRDRVGQMPSLIDIYLVDDWTQWKHRGNSTLGQAKTMHGVIKAFINGVDMLLQIVRALLSLLW